MSLPRTFAIVSLLGAMACANDAGGASDDADREIVTSIESLESVSTPSPHLMLGTPTDNDPSDDYVLTKTNYTLSYSNDKHVANWVAWRIRSSDIGSVTRKDAFAADHTLPAGWYAVVNSDYKRSGYTRGHMCPSADRTATSTANAETFLFTNIVPQTAELNSGPWERLETYERDQASAGNDVYVVAGSLFAATPPTIGHDVAVPSYNYKLVVTLPRGAQLADVTATSTVIAVNMPNTHALPSKVWTDYQVSMGDLERVSGYRFLTEVSGSIHDALAGAHPVANDE